MPRAKKQKNGKWRCQLYITETLPDGTKRNVNKSFTADTRTEAEDLASEYRKSHGKKAVANLTVEQAIDRYISARDNTLSPSTIRAYKSMKNGILEDLLKEQIRDMTSDALQRWVNRHAKEKTAKTLKNCYALVVSSIRAVDPAYHVAVVFPAKVKKEIHVPTKDEVDALLAAATDDNLRKAILLAAYCSLRRSEACAVTWADVDYKRGVICITKAMVKPTDGQGYIVKPYTKTEESRREVPAPQVVLDAMRTGGITISPDAISRRFDRLVISCKLPHIRFHDLRHFFASYLHSQGVPDAYIEKFGGWKQGSGVMREVYREALRDEEKKQADKVRELFNKETKVIKIAR